MKEIQKVVLSSAENTAYWWNMIIRRKVREIVISGARNKNEYNFANIFMKFSERDWRRLYIELADLIIDDINTFVPKFTRYGIDAFNQDTDKGQHDRLNEELSKIVGKKVPDIRLASNNYKDSVIFTNLFGVSIWYKSCGINDLEPDYDSEYILTGDERELDFYNTLLSTMLVLTPDGIKSGHYLTNDNSDTVCVFHNTADD